MTDEELETKLNRFGIAFFDNNSNFIGYPKIYEELILLVRANNRNKQVSKELLDILHEVDDRNMITNTSGYPKAEYMLHKVNNKSVMDILVSKAQKSMGQNIMNDAYASLLASCMTPNYMLGDKKVRNITKDIKRVIHNDPATIVYWNDNSKTVVKAQNGEPYDKEKGLAMCIIKKLCDNKGNFNEVFKKWCK